MTYSEFTYRSKFGKLIRVYGEWTKLGKLLNKHSKPKTARLENEGWMDADILVEAGGAIFSVSEGGVHLIGSFAECKRLPRTTDYEWSVGKKPDLWASAVFMGEVYEH